MSIKRKKVNVIGQTPSNIGSINLNKSENTKSPIIPRYELENELKPLPTNLTNLI